MTARVHAPGTDEAGFTLAALILFLTALSIAMAAAVPAYRTQALREQERELIFRGQEYVRAIQKYQRRFGIFPPDVEALLETNGVRFLRRAYTDPVTGEGFRLLTVNADGTINGSVVYEQMMANPDLFQGGDPTAFGEAPPANPFAVSGASGPATAQPEGQQGRGGFGPGFGQQNAGASSGRGGPGQTAGFGPGGTAAFGGTQSGFGQAVNPGQPTGGFGSSAAGFGQAITPGSPAGRGNGFPPGAGQSSGRGGQIAFVPSRGAAPQAGGFGSDPFATTPTTPTDGTGTAAGFGNPAFSSGGVVGVAPLNENESLIAYNQRQVYNEWEFIALPGFGTVPMAPPLGLQDGVGAENPFGESQTTPFGQPPPTGQSPAPIVD